MNDFFSLPNSFLGIPNSSRPDHFGSPATRVSQLYAQLAKGDVAAPRRLFDLTAARLA